MGARRALQGSGRRARDPRRRGASVSLSGPRKVPTCSPAFVPPPSSASTPIPCTSRWTSAAACPRSPPSACPTAPFAKAGSASARPSPTRASASRSAASPSTSPRPTSSKTGSGLDLPIALGILVASGQLPDQASRAHGRRRGRPGGRSSPRSRRPVRWRSPRGPRAAAALILPPDNVPEAAVVEGLEVRGARTLAEVCAISPATPLLPPAAVDLPALMAERRRRTSATSPMSGARPPPNGRSRWPRPALTTCCSSARPAPARPCSPAGCPPSCRP